MKRLLGLVLLAALIYGGYYYYTNVYSRPEAPVSSSVPRMKITQAPSELGDIFSVLGATTSRLWENGLEGLNSATDGQAEPIINKAVSDLQDRIKELPKEQYEKVKYEFCKGVVNNYEEKK